MQNVYLIFNEVMKDAKKLEIPFNEVSSLINISKRATKRYGNCKYIKDYDYYEITISEFLLADEVPVQSIKNTLMHELLHTCDDCMNHGTEWKKLAEIVNNAGLGYEIKRTTSRKEKGLSEIEAKPALYTLQCQNCKTVWKRRKASKFVKYPNRYKCNCGGTIKRIL